MGLIFTFALAYLEHKAAPTYQSFWCGFGALHHLRDDKQPAPMCYRVLGYPFRKDIRLYLAFKFVCVFAVLYAVQNAYGFTAMLVTAVLLPLTFWYDYWDWGVEMAGLYFAMAGNFTAALIFAPLWGLSRETAPIIGAAYFLKTGDWRGGLALSICATVAQITVRWIVGKRPLYCSRFMIFVNGKLLRALNSRAIVSVSVILLACAGAVASGRPETIAPLILCAAGVTMGKIDETRLFASALPLIYFLT